ncbi:MAG: RNA methyltransferase, partial [Gemmatimonadetes bacterium]|nr:RNA methyltransferase [Gemmatimonadota bacterium]NIR77122.1 RNA methyltransferase [Gemmatimonadota bacterium]NIT85640.1 RNA methyltransferase [Gemmatimonadota bacterium]NIU29472.1 RNA methyltransferase [Gemmatimonadota bacterium]NIV59888.1 RNA methyltransferase [Gemmatimonadota bacterium]
PEGALFDRVLVDAPCTGEGTLRRRGGRPPEPSDSFVAHLGRVQRALLEKAVRLTRPGGTVLYVTCTFAPEENEAVVSDILRSHPVELEPLELPVPHARGLARFGDARFDPRLEGAARIYPHHLDSGGLFLAKLRKLDEGDAGAWEAV